jgi:integrase
MGVTVREKKPGEWWLFVNHHGRRKSKKIGSSKAEATRLGKILEGRLASGELGMSDIAKTSVAQPFSFYCKEWLGIVMPHKCKQSTRKDYISIHKKHLKTAPFYKKPITDIAESDIEDFLISKRAKRSWSTTKNIRNAISNTFKRAIKKKVLKDNPCDNVEFKAKGEAENKLEDPYNREELEQLLETFKGDKHYPMVFFMVKTGCRAGEVAGLQWKDLNLEGRKVTISRAIVRGEVTDTKNGKSRSIDLTHALVAELRKLKIKNQKGGDWVFQNNRGGIVCMDNFRKRVWYPMLEVADLRRTRIHDLRHSFASLLIKMTKDIYYAQKMLGHSSIKVTCDRYGHLLDDEKEERGVDVLDTPIRTLSAP